MIRPFASKLSHRWRTKTMVLGLATAAGWSLFAVSSYSAAETERHLQEQIVDLQAGQVRLLSERDQLQSATTEVVQLRSQLRIAQDEATRLTQERFSAQPKLSATQPIFNANSPVVRQQPNVAARAGSVSSMPPTPPRAPARPVGAALTKPKPGVLVAETGSSDGKR